VLNQEATASLPPEGILFENNKEEAVLKQQGLGIIPGDLVDHLWLLQKGIEFIKGDNLDIRFHIIRLDAGRWGIFLSNR
jgi:hypothetical protein